MNRYQVRRCCGGLVWLAGAALCACVQGCPCQQGPKAGFTAQPRTGPAPLLVQFTDQSEPGNGTIVAWQWDFGDLQSGTEQNPVHTYVSPGVYTVSLTVSTASGDYARTEPDYIVVTGAEGEGEGEGEFTGLVQVPEPLSGDNPVYHLPVTAVPTPGAAVSDAAFGTVQRRVTQTESLRHEYSRIDPFNSDHSRILLSHLPSGEWRVYRTTTIPYDVAGNFVCTISMEEPRWDPVDPDILWGSQGFRIETVDVDTGAVTAVKDFAADATIGPIISANPDLYRITMKDEGESSIDKRYWIFALQGAQDDYRLRYLFTWDRVLNQILGWRALPQTESLIDWVGMSPLGTYALIGGDYDNGGSLTGLTMANRALTQFHRLDFGTAHADVGLDSDGNEVIVMQNVRTDFIDLIPLDWDVQPILEAGGGYTGTNRIPLMRLYYDDSSPIGLRSGVHISCNFPGYAIVSTYIAPGEPEQNWLDRSITVAELNRTSPRVFYLAKVYGTTGAYWEETHGTISVDGSRVLWTSNWNKNVGQERVWEVQLSLPAGWTDAL